jgi:hypothetical protein
MKKLAIAALVAAQVLTAAEPAFAADLTSNQEIQGGAFGGVRLRVPLGGRVRDNRVRAGFAFAPTVSSRSRDGAVRTRIGEGLELGVTGREPVRLSLAETPVNRLAQGGWGPDGRRLGISTLGWIALGVGAAIVIVVGAAAICISDHDCVPSE